MNNFKGEVTNVVRIDEQDASEFSDEHIFRIIAKLEREAEDLNKIDHKPQKLRDAVADIERRINALVNYVDNR